MTITIRRDRKTDASWLGTWLPAAAEAVGHDVQLDTTTSELRIIERDAVPVGAIIFRAPESDASAVVIELVATPAEHARKGSGMSGAELLERELRRRGIRRIYAPAPASHGIATYFWIRLGYRPLLRGDWPCLREGVAWLARDLK